MTAYYNEIDRYAAQWLRNLIDAGHIAPGVVDERSIEDVHPSDLAGFTQCHFFAGIGVWSYALRRAGWPDDRPVWTGSCPCQPFSEAGEGAGFTDQRHLWPSFHWLIQERRPPVVFGEQVASKHAAAWLDLVQADMEALGFAFGAVAFPSAAVGAPHIRDRTYWVGDARLHHHPSKTEASRHRESQADRPANQPGGSGLLAIGVANAKDDRCQRSGELGQPPGRDGASHGGATGGMANPILQQRPDRQPRVGAVHEASGRNEGAATAAGLRSDLRPGPTNGFWADADWLLCRDGKWRPVEPGTFPLAHGAPSRVGRLRAYGNAINAQAAEIFIRATL